MSDHNLAEALRQIIYQAERGTLARCEQLARDALASIYEAEQQAGEAVAWLYTLEYGGSIADRKVSLDRLRYPFGVCGADYLRVNDVGMSYVRETPLCAHGITKDTK